MSTFVLIHGAWLGKWCWYKLTPLIEQAGHRVVTFDLPAHGEDSSTVSSASLQSYIDSAAQILDQQPEPEVVVAHSMGGVVASGLAEKYPERVQTLVYLSAYLLRNGESLYGIAGADRDAKIGSYFVVKESQGTLGIQESGLREVFFAVCPDEDVVRAKTLYRDEPLAPLATPVSVSTERFGRAPRVYPFPAALLSQFSNYRTAVVIYGASLAVAGLVFDLMRAYATHRYRLVERDLHPQVIRTARRRNLTGPLIYLIGIIVCLIPFNIFGIGSIQVCLALYVLVPVIYFLPGATDSYWAGKLPTRKAKTGQKRQESSREKETTV